MKKFDFGSTYTFVMAWPNNIYAIEVVVDEHDDLQSSSSNFMSQINRRLLSLYIFIKMFIALVERAIIIQRAIIFSWNNYHAHFYIIALAMIKVKRHHAQNAYCSPKSCYFSITSR